MCQLYHIPFSLVSFTSCPSEPVISVSFISSVCVSEVKVAVCVCVWRRKRLSAILRFSSSSLVTLPTSQVFCVWCKLFPFRPLAYFPVARVSPFVLGEPRVVCSPLVYPCLHGRLCCLPSTVASAFVCLPLSFFLGLCCRHSCLQASFVFVFVCLYVRVGLQ